jgi:hypothetical protein
MFACPHCGKMSITWWQKITGTLWRPRNWSPSITCPLCGGKANLNWLNAILFQVPFILITMVPALFWPHVLEDPIGGIIFGSLVPLTFFTCLALYFKWSPLVATEKECPSP